MMSVLLCSGAGAATGRRCCDGAPPRRCHGCNEASPELRRATHAALEHRHAGLAAAMKHGRSCNGPSGSAMEVSWM